MQNAITTTRASGELALTEDHSRQLAESIVIAERMVRMQHLSALDNFDIVPLSREEKAISPDNKVRLLHIGCLTYDEKEDISEKLSGVFGAIAGYDASAIFILRHDGERVNLYMGTACEDPQILSMVFGTFERALKGNFPGCEMSVKPNDENAGFLSDIFDYDRDDNIAVASISTMASRRGNDPGMYLQGIEKLVDGMKGIPFDLVVLASALSHETISAMRSGYENLYTQLAPFYKQNATMSVTDTQSFSRSMSDSISKSLSLTTGTNTSSSFSSGKQRSSGESHEKTEDKHKALAALGLAGGVAVSLMVNNPFGMSVGTGAVQSLQTLLGMKPSTLNSSSSFSENSSESSGTNRSEGKTETDGHTDTTTDSDSHAAGRSMAYTLEDRSIGNLLEAIDNHIERLNLCEGNGAYQCAAYLISADRATAQMGASLYRSLLSGSDPLANVSYTNVWQDSRRTDLLCEYIKYMQHPRFAFTDPRGESYEITPATLSPAPDMSLHFSWPRKPLPGLMVTTHAEFARDVLTDGQDDAKTVKVGRIFHMGSAENSVVSISPPELRKHLFVAGAPGSGKSNFCYVLLDRLNKAGVKFMVIEPAKGEYSSVFGGRDDVNVFGTNSLLTPQLCINPFEFPEGVHLLEHLDRIIEVFNASWPMYAAMPALLKEGLEEAYRSCGWDLDAGVCLATPRRFPTFKTLLDILPNVLKQTEYSQEVQGNYIGSLVTRVKSMTNGICGKVFCSDTIPDEVLFDGNTIIDISRLGSAETKSLIMGIMIIRLQEYRANHRNGINEDLQHVTLLEEAHHLLRQTSSAQSMEGANLRGMSVEILTNAIAEMRTYGEAFVIADQTPSIMSEAVIGNTGTKVIFRLPNINDRVPVGNAVALNQEQIEEVAKLDTGVAVMHQNHWIKPVLCKVDYYPSSKYCPLRYTPGAQNSQKGDIRQARGTAVRLLLSRKKKLSPPADADCIRAAEVIAKDGKPTDSDLGRVLRNYLDAKELREWDNYSALFGVLRRAFNPMPLLTGKDSGETIEEWGARAAKYFGHQAELDESHMDTLISMLIVSCRMDIENSDEFYIRWVNSVKRRKKA